MNGGWCPGSRTFLGHEPGTLASQSGDKLENFPSGRKSWSKAGAEQCAARAKDQRGNGEFSVGASDLVAKKAVQHFVAESRSVASQLEDRACAVGSAKL